MCFQVGIVLVISSLLIFPLTSALNYFPAGFPERAVQNNHRSPKTTRQFRPRTSNSAQPNRWRSAPSRSEPRGFQNMKESYERYLVLARAEAQNGNTVAAENYYQHAEHYYRSMSSGES